MLGRPCVNSQKQPPQWGGSQNILSTEKNQSKISSCPSFITSFSIWSRCQLVNEYAKRPPANTPSTFVPFNLQDAIERRGRGLIYHATKQSPSHWFTRSLLGIIVRNVESIGRISRSIHLHKSTSTQLPLILIVFTAKRCTSLYSTALHYTQFHHRNIHCITGICANNETGLRHLHCSFFILHTRYWFYHFATTPSYRTISASDATGSNFGTTMRKKLNFRVRHARHD